jgi:hypothetical protein
MDTGPAALAEFGAGGDPFSVPVAANADAANPESLRNSRRVWSVLVWSVNVCSNQKGVAAEYYVDEACGTCGVRFRGQLRLSGTSPGTGDERLPAANIRSTCPFAESPKK